MNPWFGYALIGLGIAGTLIIRVPFGRKSRRRRVVLSRVDTREKCVIAGLVLLILALPLCAIVTPWLSFADYPFHPYALWAGVITLMFYFWLFNRTHTELGANWSGTLEMREGHHLVTEGVYRYVRHPMYSAMLAYGIAQAMLLPNWLAGPSSLLAFALLLFLRVPREEKMLTEQFGALYREYKKRTKKKVLPFVY